MPRAYCAECGSEVPVDADGVCHVGHRVAVGSDPVADAPTTEADEPQPWVASVDTTTLGGFTPPPGAPEAVPDEQPWTPGSDDADGDDDLAAAAAAAIESLDADAAREPAPADPPAPADDPAEDFDLDDLAAAVSDLGRDDAADAASTDAPAPPPDGPVADAPVADGPVPEPPRPTIDWDDELGDPGGRGDAGGEVASDADASDAGGADEVDLSNFTAKGGRVRTGGAGGGKGGLFRRR